MRLLNIFVSLGTLLIANSAPFPVQAAPACALSAGDKAWLDRAAGAWTYTSRNITGIQLPQRFEARIFDARCLLSSSTAMAGGPKRWTGTPHAGRITLPNGEKIPARVTSFASGDGRIGFFVMSTPSVWRAGGVNGGELGLETLMVAVLLHEGTHVAQIPTYGERIGTLSKRYNLPDSFNDDSIQERFKGNAEFAASIARETELLLESAVASEDSGALRLAREARNTMRARQDRWYPEDDAYLREAEDTWLSMEGSAQWAAYQWLVDPKGGRIAPSVALSGFGMRSKWWSQKEGFALFMALDRLTNGSWKRHSFGDGAKTVLQMLDDALGPL